MQLGLEMCFAAGERTLPVAFGSPWYRPPRNLIEQSGTEIVLFSARLGVREIFVLDAIGQILGDAVGVAISLVPVMDCPGVRGLR